jgi:hypothetical protein
MNRRLYGYKPKEREELQFKLFTLTQGASPKYRVHSPGDLDPVLHAEKWVETEKMRAILCHFLPVGALVFSFLNQQ